MTSEVLVFNKKAVVLAADSAVTSSPPMNSSNSAEERPRYSKTANKIFELSNTGSVAVALFGNSSLDLVPWEVAIKMFRQSLGQEAIPTVSAYMDRLLQFLTAHPTLFPQELLQRFTLSQFDGAGVDVLTRANQLQPSVFDPNVGMADREAAWAAAYAELLQELNAKGVKPGLSQAPLDALLADLDPWRDRAQAELTQSPRLVAVNATQLAELAHRHRYAYPERRLGETGLVVTGFGADEVFPSYRLLYVHGHVGNELLVTGERTGAITHTETSLIVPLAQKSMIDLFTDGFGFSLWSIIYDAGLAALNEVFSDLQALQINVSDADRNEIVGRLHKGFMAKWTSKNYAENYHPLMAVLATLSVGEMSSPRR